MLSSLSWRRRFRDLSGQKVLARAIASEEDDARSYAERLRADFIISASRSVRLCLRRIVAEAVRARSRSFRGGLRAWSAMIYAQ